MRKLAIAATVLGAVATLLSTTAGAEAATRYDARARLSDQPTCVKRDATGITQRTVVLDNMRSAHRVQYRVVRAGDRFADHVVYLWVKAHARRSVVVSVPQRSQVSVRVRVPEMGAKSLRLSAILEARASCYVETVDPKATLGGVSCSGSDSVARIVLDNRATSDDKVDYTVTSSYGDSTASLTVKPASATNYYLTVPAGSSTHVMVTAAGHRVLSTDVTAVSCS